MSIDRTVSRMVNFVGYVQCIAGLSTLFLGSANALRGLREAQEHGDSTGIGTFLSTMGLTGSILLGGVLFFAGRGLLKRSQMARRIQIVLAALVAVETMSVLFSPESGILERSVPIVAFLFLILMFLPSVREQFAGPRGADMPL